MKYHELKITKYKKTTRVGRGISAGKGKTAGRGTKGQNSRTGGGVRPGFEGGQMPFAMRMPKLRGFTSKRVQTQEVYTGSLDKVKSKIIDNFSLADAGIIADPYISAKLILRGEVTKPYTIKIQSCSANALSAVQKAGGSFEATERPKRQSIKEAK